MLPPESVCSKIQVTHREHWKHPTWMALLSDGIVRERQSLQPSLDLGQDLMS